MHITSYAAPPFLSAPSKRCLDKHLEKITNLIRKVLSLLQATFAAVFNPNLARSFFGCGRIYRHIPHVRAKNPIGFLLTLTEKNAAQFSEKAKKTTNGLVTYWVGPHPIFYVTENQTRLALVRESIVGSVNQASSSFLYMHTNGNNVMGTFPAFIDHTSFAYKSQRQFLMKMFHAGAKNKLPILQQKVSGFFQSQFHKSNQSLKPLRELITELVLNTSSHLLGLTQTPMNQLLRQNPEDLQMIGRVAHYTIAESRDSAYENRLYLFFEKLLKSNFDSIHEATKETNFIRNLFFSLGIPFPNSFEDFKQIDKDTRHAIAMNFSATGLGGMVHSTTNTLDWTLALLLKKKEKWNELVELMQQHPTLDLSQPSIFDKNGKLHQLGEAVLHSVYANPTFSHQFFFNSKSFKATLPDGSTITIPSKSFTIVNYLECNRSIESLNTEEKFCNSLRSVNTTGSFVTSSPMASFGGSLQNRKNRLSRRCPGAKISLYEQMMIIAILLRDYPHVVTDGQLSMEVDTGAFPLRKRCNKGKVIFSQTPRGGIQAKALSHKV